MPVPSDATIHARLVDHLRDVVTDDLAGRLARDLVGFRKPYDTVFAGVLKSSNKPESAEDVASQDEADSGGSLGLYFHLGNLHRKPLTVRVRCFGYYPVFPSYQQLQEQRDATGSVDPGRALQRITSSESSEDEPNSDAGEDEEDTAPKVAEDPGPDVNGLHTDTTVLPVWRRVEFVVPPIQIRLDPPSVPVSVGEMELALAAEQARTAAETDRARWRHLGKETESKRTLAVESFSTADDYHSALEAVIGTAVAVPPWRIGLTVQTSSVVTAPGVGVTILIANQTNAPSWDCDRGLYEHALFDASVEVDLGDNEVVPMQFHLAAKDYRSDRTMKVRGINCAGVWEDSTNTLRTESLPIYRQALERTRDDPQVPFAALAGPDTLAHLDEVSTAMAVYEGKWREYLSGEALSELDSEQQAECAADLTRFQAERKAFEQGIAALRSDPNLLRSLQLLNQAFQDMAHSGHTRARSWRIFQIVFICTHLASLRDRNLDVLRRQTDPGWTSQPSEVSVLWFATGGGKTEAYLGLIGCALLYDRLRGKAQGVTAWMRFPLRMLSLQQVERLSYVIAALNRLQALHSDLGIGDPFVIGYFVGDADTPNALGPDTMALFKRDSNERERVRMLRRCPFCSSRVRIDVLEEAWRIAHVCENEECFSNTSDALGRFRGSLPITVIDREIYRYLPSVLVGTVDKLAIIGHSTGFSHVLWGAFQVCPVHGYASFNKCLESGTARCKARLVRLPGPDQMFDAPPSLLIQDEFHLLGSELGAFDGHYENLLHFVCDRISAAPRVMAATATLADYESQAFNIYLQSARRFPQPGWRLGESFYTTSSPLEVRRQFVGVPNHVRKPVSVSLRLLSAYQREVRRLQREPDSFREMVGVATLSDVDVSRILRMHDLSVVYVTTKAVGQEIRDKAEDIERALRPERQDVGIRVLTGDQPVDEVGDVIEQVAREADDLGPERLDVLVATSIISHGVDLERLNMLVMAGTPSHYAEYLQASSRSARSLPGLVFSCFNLSDVREHSQYEFFPEMHKHIDRLIESVPVNRYAANAPSKTVPGIVAGLLMSYFGPALMRQRMIDRSLDQLMPLRVALGLQPGPAGQSLQRDEVLHAVREVIGVDAKSLHATAAEVDIAKRRVDDEFDHVYGLIGRAQGQYVRDVLDILRSFRDVDEGVDFGTLKSIVLLQSGDSR